jgi:hypothetical protein
MTYDDAVSGGPGIELITPPKLIGLPRFLIPKSALLMLYPSLQSLGDCHGGLRFWIGEGVL